MTIPAGTMARLVTLGLSAGQAAAVAEMLVEVERATRADVEGAAEARLAGQRAGNAERQRRFRAARNACNVTDRDITLRDVTDRDVTPPVPPEVSPKDNNQTPILPPSRIEGAQARGKRLPEDWLPSDASLQVASMLGLDASQTQTALAEFKNYWLSESGQRARKISWDRTFQNRLAEVAPRILRGFARAGPPANSKPSVQDVARRIDEQINGSFDDMFSDRDSDVRSRSPRLLSSG